MSSVTSAQPMKTGNAARQSQQASRSANPNPDEIAKRAYAIWERNGHPEGQCEQHWQQAEAELRNPR